MYIYDQNGIKRNTNDLNAVDRLFKLKETSGSNPWPVIEQCVQIWEATNPSEYRSFLYELEEVKKTRKNKFAASDEKADPTHNGILRYTLDIPEKVMFMIRCVYSAEELVMDKEFLRLWARKFPKMKIAERI